MQLLIYCPKITPRVKYIFNFIFREILRTDFELISIAEDFNRYEGPKFSYAENPLGDELFFCASTLLFNNNVETFDIKIIQFGDSKVPFAINGGALPFDVFAASFYFVSRYEEYLDFEPDSHFRFPAEQSLQYKLDVLKQPIVDNWAIILKNIILKKFPKVFFGKRKFEFIPTIDIDRAYHFRSSGFLKNTARIIRAVASLDTERLKNIISTGLGTNKDPYDTYQYLHNLHEQYHLQPIFFFLLSQYGHKKYDVNIHPEDELLQTLIQDTSKHATIGIHPSYASNSNTLKINEELATLQKVIHKKIDLSRQHFLKLHFPKTYLQLIKAGINHDYSMGYASQLGFRAGTCTPFFWYDLQIDKQSHLKIHPFAVMDVTLRQYLNLQPAEAIEKIDELLVSVKLVNGTFYSLWHNEALSEAGKWKNWKSVYEFLIKTASS